MKTLSIPFQEALSQLLTVYPKASPNLGFIEQLKMFENMGYKVDVTSVEYRLFRLSKMAEEIGERGFIQNLQLSRDPATSMTTTSTAAATTTSTTTTNSKKQASPVSLMLSQNNRENMKKWLTCKKCR